LFGRIRDVTWLARQRQEPMLRQEQPVRWLHQMQERRQES
jgi:hypothetical protein